MDHNSLVIFSRILNFILSRANAAMQFPSLQLFLRVEGLRGRMVLAHYVIARAYQSIRAR